jgi:hypothetical protein
MNDNWALLFALEKAAEKGVPCAVAFNLVGVLSTTPPSTCFHTAAVHSSVNDPSTQQLWCLCLLQHSTAQSAHLAGMRAVISSIWKTATPPLAPMVLLVQQHIPALPVLPSPATSTHRASTHSKQSLTSNKYLSSC